MILILCCGMFYLNQAQLDIYIRYQAILVTNDCNDSWLVSRTSQGNHMILVFWYILTITLRTPFPQIISKPKVIYTLLLHKSHTGAAALSRGRRRITSLSSHMYKSVEIHVHRITQWERLVSGNVQEFTLHVEAQTATSILLPPILALMQMRVENRC